MSVTLLFAAALEVMVQCDTWDFGAKFDIQTAEGNSNVLGYIAGVAPDTIAWRVNGGSLQQFACREESRPRHDPPRDMDLRRVPDTRALNGWLRLAGERDGGIDLLRAGMDALAARKWRRALYMPFEDNHFYLCKIGTWNFEHPQYWTRSRGGAPLMTRCSLAFPEVREHRLRILDEALAYGADTLYIEVGRTGTWTAGDEYVRPNLARWRELHPGEPLPEPSDERWLRVVAESQYAYFKSVREHLNRTGRKVRFLFGVYGLGSDGTDPNWSRKAMDWPRYARERIVDGIVVAGVFPDWKRPVESTREIYLAAKAKAAGCEFFVPVSMYHFCGAGIATYAREMKATKEASTRMLLALAKDVGATGILLECVDYGNYSPEQMKIIREER